MKDFLELSQTRYATKHYDPDRKIPQKDIDTLLEIARLTPSAVNIQPWHFYVGSTQKAKDLILPAIPDFNIPRIQDCSHFIVLCSKTKMAKDEYDALTEQEFQDGRFSDPKLKEAIGSHRMGFGQMHEKSGDFSQWTAKQVYLAMAALLYGAASMGIDSTPIEGMDFAKADEILGLKAKNLQTVGIVALGYRKDDSNALRPKSRLAKETIISSID
ncbi:MAG: nitroreductase family protein [Succinivibrio sp.]|jgi:nitroreductase/dihydropteridine reductase|nr:nitroreductase family protein [Succinivibrio sp.]